MIRACLHGLAALSILVTTQVTSQEPEVPVRPGPTAEQVGPTGPAPEPAPLIKPNVEAWLDGLMPYALQRGDIAGAVVVVVKGGEVLTGKGYGYADVERRMPVDPDRTLFRLGSVSKLFTWTAVMQLVEQGKLELDRDVNAYLDFKIPPAFDTPITLRHIMTHTAGFEEVAKNLIVEDTSAALTNERFLKSWTPRRIFRPGRVPAYSNYATALAGYIVERVSGEPFEDYVERHIFAPLGMERSTFRQPLPAPLAADMSKGYDLGSETDSPKPYELVTAAPAGSLASSGADMGRFMLAHLQQGRLGDAVILKPGTARRMHETALTVIPPLNRMLLGFYETNRNGRRIIAHGGDTYWFHSDLHLFIDDGVGLFVSMNSAGKEGASGAIRTALFEQFADRYLPGETPAGAMDSATAARHARFIAGSYQVSRRPESSFLSLGGLFEPARVSTNDDGTISVSYLEGLNGQPKRWREARPFVWREVGGGHWLAAKVDSGRITMWSGDELSPFMMFQPVPWWRSSLWLLPLFFLALLVLGLTAIAWPVAALVRRHYRIPNPLSGRDAAASRLVKLAAFLVMAGILCWLVLLRGMSTEVSYLGSRVVPWVLAVQLVTLVAFVGALVASVWNAQLVWRSKRSRWAKAWSASLVVASATLVWVGIAFNLIGFDRNF